MQWFYSLNVDTECYYTSKCMKRMQIHWNASSYKNRYIELFEFELEQYKLSGQIMRRQFGSATMLRDTYIHLSCSMKKIMKVIWQDREAPERLAVFHFYNPDLHLVLYLHCQLMTTHRYFCFGIRNVLNQPWSHLQSLYLIRVVKYCCTFLFHFIMGLKRASFLVLNSCWFEGFDLLGCYAEKASNTGSLKCLMFVHNLAWEHFGMVLSRVDILHCNA